ncbi:hypothetical protein BUALT_Bualt02G0163200 [Buddleja alternifolia]|uniref:DNA excision repair protein ERCC-6-like n=1 Tax=Buddleja alternifolia TaxID=168488 RepID=A0AAV6Y7U5_9LAMI|nr:hypothetical protein BUALT_Bualt02G0163200 [Buddleja alternifolia]
MERYTHLYVCNDHRKVKKLHETFESALVNEEELFDLIPVRLLLRFKIRQGNLIEVSDDEPDEITILDYDDEDFVLSGPEYTYRLPGKIAKKLYPHQLEGLKWFWNLHCEGKGGILGDDMGLGKTMQICSFMAGLFYSKLTRRILIVVPRTLLKHWITELSTVGLSEKTREHFILLIIDGGILLTTYGIVQNNAKLLCRYDHDHDSGIEAKSTWDYMILDEGHLIKDPSTQRAKSLHQIRCPHRIIISGTPLQNNLKELWALFNFCCPELLGSKIEFLETYDYLINRANEKNAFDREKHIGSSAAKDLRDRIQPHFMRRLKNEVFLGDTAFPKKNEITVWLRLTPCQRQLYETFLKHEIVSSAFERSAILTAITGHLIPKGHKVLIFSQTRIMLDYIQESLISKDFKCMRMDGFPRGSWSPIVLLTSKVGGLGLTLTNADRVIVVDLAWNPSIDNQCVDRAYRIGQKKDVVVYRLMTSGTVEEIIYIKQILKLGLFRIGTEHKEPTRYFSQEDLENLFSLPEQGFDISPTQQQLNEEHDNHHIMEESLRSHVELLKGISHHSLLFSKTTPLAVQAVNVNEKLRRVREADDKINGINRLYKLFANKVAKDKAKTKDLSQQSSSPQPRMKKNLILFGHSDFCLSHDALVAESRAIVIALDLFGHLVLPFKENLFFENDSLEAVQMISNINHAPSWSALSDINGAKSIMIRHLKWKLKKIPCLENKVAHNLAKWTSVNDSFGSVSPSLLPRDCFCDNSYIATDIPNSILEYLVE